MRTQVIIELDPAMSAELERVAPSRDRRRSEFIRAAIRKALDEVAEAQMAEAYRAVPDHEPAYFDPAAWTPSPAPLAKAGRAARRKAPGRAR